MSKAEFAAKAYAPETEQVPALLPVYSHIQYPFNVVRGEDVFVYDETGKRYLDFYGGHCVTCVGHCRKEVADAIAAQAHTLLFYSNLAPMPLREDGAKRLVSYADSQFTSAFFCNSGGEANENALKIAIKATGRSKVVGYTGGFHGRTLLALGATDNTGWHQLYRDWLGPVGRITPNDLAGLVSIDEQTACVILEPIQSIGGVTVFEESYLQALRDVCTKKGAMLIFDEVQTGLGRTGVPFVSGHWGGVQPEMMTLAKGLAGGFAAGAVVMTKEVAATIKPGDIAATFGGGPLAIAAMIATIDCLEKDGLAAHSKAMEQYITTTLNLPQVSEIRGKGLLIGLVLDRPAKPVQQALFAKGIITGTNSNPNLLHLLPPLTVQQEHVDMLKAALLQVLG